MIKETINVIYSSDDNYAQHMGVSILSLIVNNKEFEKINFYVINNGISQVNKEKLDRIIATFDNVYIKWIDFSSWSDKLELNMMWDISISSYARLFVGSMLPSDIKRVLYLDCDMIICGTLDELWHLEMEDYVLCAVQDTVNGEVKQAIGVNEETPYFNAGMLLINLDKWRQERIEESCLDFIKEHDGRVLHHDQGVLNGVLSEKCKFVSLKFNIMTIHYIWNRDKVLKYSEEKAQFFSEQEISDAKENPIILHYTPSFTCRPWFKGCKHPKAQLYWKYLKDTPWQGAVAVKNTEKWYVRLINWRYRNLPLLKK